MNVKVISDPSFTILLDFRSFSGVFLNFWAIFSEKNIFKIFSYNMGMVMGPFYNNFLIQMIHFDIKSILTFFLGHPLLKNYLLR